MSATIPAEAEFVPGQSNGHLTPEMIERMVARAKDYINGRILPPVPPTMAETVAMLQREFGDKNPPPTARATRHIADRWYMERTFHGVPIINFECADGSIAVLAAGEAEIDALLPRLSKEERRRAIFDTTN